MLRKTTIIVSVLLLWTSLAQAKMDSNGGKDEAAYALLDKLVLSFKDMAEKGAGGEAVSDALNEMMASAKKAEVQGQIDPVFFRRFKRILIILKLAITADKEGILEPVIEREIEEFVKDIFGETGADVNKNGKPVIGIGQIAGAVAEEILNLRIYLDTKEEKMKLMEEYKKQFTSTKKKEEKK
jgi:hypothetical protein